MRPEPPDGAALESQSTKAAKQFGGRLFGAVFADSVHRCLRNSLDEASRRRAGLRIRLRLGSVPALADLPWEFLYNADFAGPVPRGQQRARRRGARGRGRPTDSPRGW